MPPARIEVTAQRVEQRRGNDSSVLRSCRSPEDPAEDTLSRLRRAVADHQGAPDAEADERLAVILGLCDTYFDRHAAQGGKWSGKKVVVVEDIKAEAMLERGRRQAEAR